MSGIYVVTLAAQDTEATDAVVLQLSEPLPDIEVSTGLTTEAAQDVVGQMFVPNSQHNGITFTYNDVDGREAASVQYGTTANTAAEGNDSRLSNARTPTGGAGGVLSGSYPSPGFAVDMASQAELDTHTGSTANPHSVTKAQVGLGNVDNTADTAKPVSTAQQTALNGKADTTRTVSAGTGLTGGGDLSANRTLAVSYGSSAGTSAQGNDSRLSDARTPTAHTHGIADLTATGTRDTTTFLRGDNTFAVPAGGSGGGGITTEDAQDAAASLITGATHSGVTFVYDDAANTLTATVISGAAAGTPSLRALGTTSTTAAAGNHTHNGAFSGARTVSADTTAVAGEVLKVNAATGNRTITPPASPAAGTTVTLVKTDSSTNTVLWNTTVNGDVQGARISAEDVAATLLYDGTEWLLTAVNTAYSGAPTAADPLREINTAKLRWSRIEAVSLVATTEQTLLNVTGPGCVQSVWMAVDKVAAIDGRLRVYYDGSSTPTIDIDAGTLWASHYSPPNPVNTPHMAFDQQPDATNSNFPSGYFMSFPMPFGTSIKIGFYSPSGATAAFYSQVAYRLSATDAANGKRLRAAGFRYADQAVTRVAGATNTLANITGGPGSLIWHSYVGGAGATNRTWMERNIEVTVDGEGSPSILATGTEDWFDGAWYYGDGRKSVNTSAHSYVATDMPIGATNVVGMATDLLSKWGGIPFTTSCLVRALPEAMCTTGDTFVSCFLYYQ